jgi:hypothetical protein
MLPAADFGLPLRQRGTEAQKRTYIFSVLFQCFCASVAISICEANKNNPCNLRTEPVEVSVAKRKTAKQFKK